MYIYGHPGSFNSAVKTNKEAHMSKETSVNNETWCSQAVGFYKKTSRKFLPLQPVALVKRKAQSEAALTPYFKGKENS